MTKLGLLDQAFLKTEQGGLSPMYMGGATILDPSTSPYPLDAHMLASHIAAQMEKIPLMRQRLVQDKLRIGNVRLEDDPDFDINNHVSVVHLEGPAGYDELTEYLAQFSVRRLDLERPLWHYEVIDGLANGQIAMAMHLHHSILDGVGAGQALAGLWSDSPVPAETPRSRAWKVTAQSGTLKMIGGAIVENVKRFYADTPMFIWQNSRPILKALGAQLGKRLRQDSKSEADTGIHLPEVQKTSLNISGLSNSRVVAYLELPLVEIKALKNEHDCSINDLALFLNSYALSHYFEGIGEEINFDLVAAMPINMRAEGDVSAGNSMGFARVNLHNTIANARERLDAITRDTRKIKRNTARSGKTDEEGSKVDFGKLSELFSPVLLEAIVYGVTRFELLDKLPPFVNVSITNVPGPPGPIFIAGAKQVTNIPMAPCFDILALTVTITSSEDRLAIGYHGCGEAIQNKELLVEGVRRGLAALKGKYRGKTSPKRKKAPAKIPGKGH